MRTKNKKRLVFTAIFVWFDHVLWARWMLVLMLGLANEEWLPETIDQNNH